MAKSRSAPGALSRRAFLTAGGAVFGSALLLGPNGATKPTALATLARQPGRRISVGYVTGSEGATAAELSALLAEGGTTVVPATSLRSGGGRLLGGSAKVQLEGTARGLASTDLRGAQLDALLQSRGTSTDEVVPFYALTIDRDSGADNGPPVSVTVPFEREPTIGFTLRTRTDSVTPQAWAEATSVFTGGADRGLPKLREGTYLLGMNETTWSSSKVLPAPDDPRWSQLASLVLSVHRD
ncbi:MAG TPA: hypothetical protein VF230_08165 [Acidimicrobiales bacterium]